MELKRATHKLVLSTGEPAYAVDRRGRILAWNDAASEALGYPATGMIGSSCWERMRGEDVFGNAYCGHFCPHRAMATRHQPIRRCRLRLATAAGERRTFTVSTLTLFGQPGDEVLIHLLRPCTDELPSTTAGTGAAGDRALPLRKGILTPREGEVLQALADGRSTREIAALLSISIPTVRNHIEHLLSKLHCHSRLEAVAAARRLKLL